jgi:membrane associated rhomboid family serine protease
MTADLIPPWEKEDAFPEKPTDKEYGYIHRGKSVGCSREELIKKCGSRDDFSVIHLVWCPEWPRVTPAAKVAFLSDALYQRRGNQLSTTIQVGWFCLLIWGALSLLDGGRTRVWMLFVAISTGLIPLLMGYHGRRKLKGNRAYIMEEQLAVERYHAWVLSRRIVFTWVLLGAIATVFALQFFDFTKSASAAGLDKAAVWRGEWWRLLTGPLLHGNPMHFIFNASVLVGLGRLMEVLASRYHLALVFLISAMTGSIFSLFLLPNVTSVGASGGLLGLIGFLAVLGVKRKQTLPPGFARSMALNVAIIAAMGIFAYALIDNAAHLGGFLAGIVLGLCLIDSNDRCLPLMSSRKIQFAGTLALALTLGFAGFAMFRLLPH